MLLNLDGDKWKLTYSKDCPPTCSTTDEGWKFNVKGDRQPHYILTSAGDKTRSTIKDAGSSLVVAMNFAEAAFRSVQDGGSNCYATVILQRKDDNLSGDGKYEFYRLWAHSRRIKMVDGAFEVTIPIEKAMWTGVLGKVPSDGAFAGTLSNLAKIGVTLGGGSDFGHGVKGSGKIRMTKFEVL